MVRHRLHSSPTMGFDQVGVVTPNQGTVVVSDSEKMGFFSGSNVAFAILDARQRVMEANIAAGQLWAIDLDRIVGSDISTMFVSPDIEILAKRFSDAADGTPVHFRALARTVDGSGSPVEVHAAALDDDTIGVVLHDLSTLQRLEQQHVREAEQYRSLFSNAPLPMREEDFSAVGEWLRELRASGIHDLNSYLDNNPEEVEAAIRSVRPLRVNPACVRLLKADSAGQVLAGFRDVELTPGVVASFRTQFEALWNGETHAEYQFIGQNYVGETFECRIYWNLRRNPDPSVLHIDATMLDFTDLRRTQNRLEQQIADRDDFLSGVSHQIRTPLAAVLGLSEELQFQWDDLSKGERLDLLSIVVQQGFELAGLVEDLLVAASAEMDQVKWRPEATLLVAEARRAIDLLDHARGRKVDIDLRGHEIAAWADPGRVRQILRNLISNAIKHGGSRVLIEVGGEETENRAFVDVRDDGNGIPEEYTTAAFEPYWRSHRHATNVTSLGIGLSVARDLARTMGGDVTYSYDDGWATFRLCLPLTRSET
jgi:signal transduction histidine kinase